MEESVRREILIVDDDPADRAEMVAAMKAGGFQTVEAESGNHALRVLEQKGWTWVPAAILVDLIMPELSGYDLIRRLFAKFDRKKVPILVVSKLSTGDDIVEAQYAGAATYVMKPFTSEKLLKAVQDAIADFKNPQEGRNIKIEIVRPDKSQ